MPESKSNPYSFKKGLAKAGQDILETVGAAAGLAALAALSDPSAIAPILAVIGEALGLGPAGGLLASLLAGAIAKAAIRLANNWRKHRGESE